MKLILKQIRLTNLFTDKIVDVSKDTFTSSSDTKENKFVLSSETEAF